MLLKNILDCLKSKFNILTKDDEKYHRKLECSLIRCLSEIRKQEISDVKLPNDFNKKLINRLQQEKIIIQQRPLSEKFSEFVLTNRPLQYSLSGVLLLTIVVVISGNRNSKNENMSNSTSGVLLENTEYLNKPSASYYLHSEEERILLDEFDRDPNSMETLRKLEAYYTSVGKEELAARIRYRAEKISGRK